MYMFSIKKQLLKPPPLGLVLSGGGVRGMAHIGVIKVMEELGISADYVAGTSAGALVGAFYAAGYSADEMLAFFQNTPLFSFQNLSFKKNGWVDIEKLMPAFQTFFPEDSFESLQRKLYVTATDLLKPSCTIFESGKLIERILASAAIPLVFTPVKMDNSIYVDGGISNNFPIEPLLPHCSQIIGVYVNPIVEMKETDISSRLGVLERAYHIGIALPAVSKFEQCTIFISPEELTAYKSLDKKHISTIYEIGYKAAKKMIPLFKALKK